MMHMATTKAVKLSATAGLSFSTSSSSNHRNSPPENTLRDSKLAVVFVPWFTNAFGCVSW